MFRIAALLIGLAVALTGRAQSFEVASVKRSVPDVKPGMIQFPKGAFRAAGITAISAITLAYNVPQYQVTGGPAWIESDLYDFDAKMPLGEGAAANSSRIEPIRTALVGLLGERFQLKVHKEMKTVPAFVLTVSKGGLKMKESADDGHGNFGFSAGKLQGKQMPIEILTKNLSGILSCPVVDMTGIKGVYDWKLEWTPDSKDAELAVGPSIFTALEEQLGLKLEKQKAPVEMIVIDRIEKPGDN